MTWWLIFLIGVATGALLNLMAGIIGFLTHFEAFGESIDDEDT